LSNRLCFIGGGLKVGGQERAMVFLANSLAKKGYSVIILCLFKTHIDFDLHPKIKVVFPSFNRDSLNKFVYAILLIPYIRKSIKRHHSNTMICFGDWFNSYAVIATFGLKVRKVITNRMGPNLFLGRVVENLNKFFYKYSDVMVVQTLRAKEIIERKYSLNEVKVIPNPIQPFGYNRSDLHNNILTIGRLSKEKGHEILVQAFSLLEHKKWILHIVGDGREKDNLQDLVKSLNLEERVVFHGLLKDFKHLLANSDIFVLPSLYEGFPNALLEAMGSGLCCVASDCVAGPSELIKNNYSGKLFEPGNYIELSLILNELILDKELRDSMARNAFDSLIPYERNSIVNQFEEVLFTNEVISN